MHARPLANSFYQALTEAVGFDMFRFVTVACFGCTVGVHSFSWQSKRPAENASEVLFLFDNETASHVGSDRLQNEFEKAYQRFESRWKRAEGRPGYREV